ncbi:hypothetical protein L8R85_25415 [Vibrio splendidus]|uniref:Uncharacterized protein n=1 Tax=Vibrio splendidus TaxID=29497 RepID=A0AA43G2G9_VIBSP|nr:hypothetical protein [Vibrio splendidus]MDH5924341.1 hypothetical protein [Vibrio splendidus]
MIIYPFSKLAAIHGPQTIDPYNSALNSDEVYPHLSASEQNIVDECVDYISELPITKEGRLYLRNKRMLSTANIEVSELYRQEPEYSDRVYIEVSIPTSEEKSMPDCYGYHMLIVEKWMYD